MVARMHILMAIGLLALAAAGADPAPRPSPGRRERAANPHWDAAACKTCHTIENGAATPIPPGRVDELCNGCHDGRKAAAEFHPVDRVLERSRFKLPEKWPLLDGRLTCQTCHDMKAACSENARRSVVNRLMLRDYLPGNSRTQPFCLNCHQDTAYRKLNPHEMLGDTPGRVREDRCLMCHEKPMETSVTKRTGDPMLKTDEQSLCRTCHAQHKDTLQIGHMGLTVSADMAARMSLRESLGLQSQIGLKLLAQAKSAGLKPTKIALSRGRSIACSTCHNPHQEGVFAKESALSYLGIRKLEDGRLQSPVRGQAWCRHCHPF